jgi:hypothetical protein
VNIQSIIALIATPSIFSPEAKMERRETISKVTDVLKGFLKLGRGQGLFEEDMSCRYLAEHLVDAIDSRIEERVSNAVKDYLREAKQETGCQEAQGQA